MNHITPYVQEAGKGIYTDSRIVTERGKLFSATIRNSGSITFHIASVVTPSVKLKSDTN